MTGLRMRARSSSAITRLSIAYGYLARNGEQGNQPDLPQWPIGQPGRAVTVVARPARIAQAGYGVHVKSIHCGGRGQRAAVADVEPQLRALVNATQGGTGNTSGRPVMLTVVPSRLPSRLPGGRHSSGPRKCRCEHHAEHHYLPSAGRRAPGRRASKNAAWSTAKRAGFGP